MSERKLAGLEPKAVFGYFEELCAISRLPQYQGHQ